MRHPIHARRPGGGSFRYRALSALSAPPSTTDRLVQRCQPGAAYRPQSKSTSFAACLPPANFRYAKQACTFTDFRDTAPGHARPQQNIMTHYHNKLCSKLYIGTDVNAYDHHRPAKSIPVFIELISQRERAYARIYIKNGAPLIDLERIKIWLTRITPLFSDR
ncbi:hypothetical protein CHELA20_50078 [Hyphomicrobiales bacterium]|nr:hypothetical protein CHELA41_20294 [Hyphomicrobiales bacterium]CAH1666531.1 hypothetical protein CHELA20_50078 [Hyphomicrobiales bacterium]